MGDFAPTYPTPRRGCTESKLSGWDRGGACVWKKITIQSQITGGFFEKIVLKRFTVSGKNKENIDEVTERENIK